MLTDRLFHDGAFKALQMQSKFAPTYFYYFRVITKTGIAPSLKKIGSKHYSESADLQDDHLGVSHGDDVFLIYLNPSSRGPTKIPYSKEEKMVGHELITLYYNFAATNFSLFNNVTIEKVDASDVKCLEIFSSQNFSIVTKDDQFGNVKFWDSLDIIE